MQELDWIREIKRGNTEYLEPLYEAYHGRIFALCLRFTRNRSDAEEQLQEIFMRILAKIDSFAERSSFSTWIYRLATNHLINFTNKGKGREEINLEEAPEGRALGRDHDLAMALRKAVADLPEGFRKVFILHDQQGLKHDEIGDILGISPATSRSQLCRARLALREVLKPLREHCA